MTVHAARYLLTIHCSLSSMLSTLKHTLQDVDRKTQNRMSKWTLSKLIFSHLAETATCLTVLPKLFLEPSSSQDAVLVKAVSLHQISCTVLLFCTYLRIALMQHALLAPRLTSRRKTEWQHLSVCLSVLSIYSNIPTYMFVCLSFYLYWSVCLSSYLTAYGI